MARYTGPVCKICRREGVELFLKGERCLSAKCAVKKRNYPPGMHGRRRIKHSDYGVQLREKQKMRRTYRMMEAQFRNYFKEAAKSPMVTGEKLIQLLEGRLDNVIYRMGFASSRNQARQLVLHGFVMVGDRRVNLPSFQVKPETVLMLTERGKQMHVIQSNLQAAMQRGVVPWVEVDAEKMTGRLLRLPTKEEVALPVEESMVIELYSR
jgi:small subunit ribosomal protein S4